MIHEVDPPFGADPSHEVGQPPIAWKDDGFGLLAAHLLG
jgi:hypothetical protein